MQVRCAFVHVDHGIEQFQMRISLLKAAGICFKHRSRFFTHIGIHSGIITVADLEYRFMEFFFLSAVAAMFLIICDLPVTSGLLIVILRKRFIEQLMDSGEEQNGQYIIILPRGDVWLFARRKLTAGVREYDQLTAADVTERYRITEELKAKNEHLQELQTRMKAVSELSGDMFVAQEEANARSALHNQLGQVLLMGRHLLVHPENTDAKMVCIATKQMNAILLGEYKGPVPEAEDLLRQTAAMAKSIGVTVELSGTIPESESVRIILAHAVQECAANTVKHASGDCLTVEVADDGDSTSFVIANNGEPPKAVIVESGGLLSLRRSIEAAGGTMTVLSEPEFLLSVKMPKYE